MNDTARGRSCELGRGRRNASSGCRKSRDRVELEVLDVEEDVVESVGANARRSFLFAVCAGVVPWLARR